MTLTTLLAAAVIGLTPFSGNLPSDTQNAPAKLRNGDVVSLVVMGYTEYSGDYAVQSDGAIYPAGLGRIEISGLTLIEAQNRIAGLLKRVIKEPHTSLGLKQQRKNVIYTTSDNPALKEIELLPELDLRRVISQIVPTADADEVEVTVYRKGDVIATTVASEAISGKPSWTGPFMADDLVVVVPTARIRAWVIGSVTNPGRVRLRPGDDLYRAVSSVGAIVVPNDGTQRDELSIRLRRGPDLYTFPTTPSASYKNFIVESGDVITVDLPSAIKVTMAGSVKNAGSLTVHEGTTVREAIGRAQGTTAEANWQDVMIFRGDQIFHESMPTLERPSPNSLVLQSGDFVYVPTLSKSFVVLGQVQRPGRYVMRPEKTYHVADALAEAGGLVAGGTYRRLTIVRGSASGKVTTINVNLDDYLKQGKLEANPLLQPEDVILMGTAKSTLIEDLTRPITAFFLFQNLFKK